MKTAAITAADMRTYTVFPELSKYHSSSLLRVPPSSGLGSTHILLLHSAPPLYHSAPPLYHSAPPLYHFEHPSNTLRLPSDTPNTTLSLCTTPLTLCATPITLCASPLAHCATPISLITLRHPYITSNIPGGIGFGSINWVYCQKVKEF
jgi:hypothetical protein